MCVSVFNTSPSQSATRHVGSVQCLSMLECCNSPPTTLLAPDSAAHGCLSQCCITTNCKTFLMLDEALLPLPAPRCTPLLLRCNCRLIATHVVSSAKCRNPISFMLRCALDSAPRLVTSCQFCPILLHGPGSRQSRFKCEPATSLRCLIPEPFVAPQHVTLTLHFVNVVLRLRLVSAR